MSTIYNKTTIPPGGSIVYSPTALQKVIYAGKQVWQRRMDLIKNGIKQIAFTALSGTTVVQNADHIALGSYTTEPKNGVMFSTAKVDVTNFTKMYAKMYAVVFAAPQSSNFGFGIISTQNADDNYAYGFFRNHLSPDEYDSTFVVDISRATGLYYVKLKAFNSGCKVYNVWFE